MSREANERHEHRSPARSNHPRPPRNHHRRSLLPRPGAGEQARGSQMRKSPQEGVGRYQMMVDIFNRLVSHLMGKQASKKNETPGHRPMRLVPRLVFFSSRQTSRRYRLNPVAIDTGFYKLSGRVRYVSLLVRKWKMPSSNCTLHTPPSPGEYSNCST